VPRSTDRRCMGKNWGSPRFGLGMTERKMGRTSGFRGSLLTLEDARFNLCSVRRREPAEPRARTARKERGKPEGKPQGGTEGGRENAVRRDRGPAGKPARGTLSEWAGRSVLRWSVVRHGDFPGVAGTGSGGGCPTRPRRDASGDIVDVAPRSTGGFGRTVTRGCVASGHMFAPFRSARPWNLCGRNS